MRDIFSKQKKSVLGGAVMALAVICVILNGHFASAQAENQIRTLSDSEKTCLAGTLPNHTDIKDVIIYTLLHDAESDAYADNFIAVFKHVGIASHPVYGGLESPTQTGIMVAVPNLGRLSPQAEDFEDILANCGLSPHFIQRTPDTQFSATPPTFELVLGPQL